MSPIEIWLAIVEPEHVLGDGRLTADEWRQVLGCGIDGVSIRVPTKGSVALAQSVHAAGLRVAVESWFGESGSRDSTPTDAADGARFGAKLAEWVAEHDAEAGRADGESELMREMVGGKKLANPHFDEALNAMAEEYHSHNAGELEDVSIGDPAQFYPALDRDRDGHVDNTIPASYVARVRRKFVMAYQRSPVAIARKIGRSRSKAWANKPLGAYVSPPRLNSAGYLVGLPASIVQTAVARPHDIEAIVVYIGMDQVKGAALAPQNPWTTLIPRTAPTLSVVDIVSQIRMAERSEAVA